MRMTVHEIAAACGGKLLCGDGAADVTGFVTDSRQAGPGLMFVPVVGEKVDAHRFIPQVVAAGAAASFTEREETVEGATLVYVEDTVAALQKAAAAWRSRFSIPVVGITGQRGKNYNQGNGCAGSFCREKRDENAWKRQQSDWASPDGVPSGFGT